MSEKPANQITIDELSANVTSPEDAATLQAWQQEQDFERAAVLGGRNEAPNEFVLQDGVAVTEEEYRNNIAQGNHTESGPYSNGRRA